MATPHAKHPDPASWPAPTLTHEERMLVVLRDELYSGSWERMLQDLRERRRGRPYLFRLVNRIQTDINRIERLQERERGGHANLGDSMRTGWGPVRDGRRAE